MFVYTRIFVHYSSIVFTGDASALTARLQVPVRLGLGGCRELGTHLGFSASGLVHELALRVDAGLSLPATVADLPLELLGIIEIGEVHPNHVEESHDAGYRKADPPEHGVELGILAGLLERPEGLEAGEWSHVGLIMHVVEHLVDAKAVLLLMGLGLLRLYLSVELLAIYLTVDVEGLHGLFRAGRLTVVHTIKEHPMASLQKMRTPSHIIVLHHLPPERR